MTDPAPLPLHEDPGYRQDLERALSETLAFILDHAAGAPELAPHDFEAMLVSVRHLASELRWLTIGEQSMPF